MVFLYISFVFLRSNGTGKKLITAKQTVHMDSMGEKKKPGVSTGKVEIFKVSAIPIYIMVIFSQQHLQTFHLFQHIYPTTGASRIHGMGVDDDDDDNDYDEGDDGDDDDGDGDDDV